MKRHLIKLLTTFAAVTLVSCGGFGRPTPAAEPEKKENPARRLIGRIASVDHENGFVLIKSFFPWDIARNTVLTTSGDQERRANLLVTGETQGNYAAADIQSGDVAIGDSVYLQQLEAPPPPPQQDPF